MGRRQAVVRADASMSLGSGHVRRCLVLAEALADAGWGITFATCSGALELMPSLARGAFARVEVRESGQAGELRQLVPSGCNLLLVDQYDLDASFERECRGWAKHIAVIDDLADRPHDCDVLVDQTPGRTADDYRPLVPSGCAILAGPSYALLDRGFRIVRERGSAILDSVGRVLVSFGGTDPDDMTSVALNALEIAALDAEVDVVLGASSLNIGRVRETAASLSLKTSIHVDVECMPKLMQYTDLAIGAGGVSSLERCCLGIPSLLVILAENQRGNAHGLARSGAAILLGCAPDATPAAMAEALLILAHDPARRRAMSAAGRALCDGGGARRVVDVLGQLDSSSSIR